MRFTPFLAWLICLGATSVAATRTALHLQAWLHSARDSRAEASRGKPNILLVVLDTLRADEVGVYAGGALTPQLDQLAESSIVYTQAMSTAPWTLPTHASLFTGLYPESHGVNWGHYALEDRAPVLAELLQAQGYDTFAISNNWLLTAENGYARGFRAFIETSRDPLLSSWKLVLKCTVPRLLAGRFGLSGDAGFDAGSSLTNCLLCKRFAAQTKSGRPFFAFVNYFEPHDPYLPLKRFRDRLLPAEEHRLYRKLPQSETYLAAQACGLPGILSEAQIAALRRLYQAEVAYQDEAIGELVESLQGQGLLDDTWLVIMSDHGELFGEWGMVYHTAGSHFRLLHIPLIVRPPGGVPGRRIASPVQPVDVFVTLLEAAGATVPAHVHRACRLPLNEEKQAQRRICVAQTHGASIAALSICQRLKLQADLAHWMTWVTSVMADGYLLEMDSSGPRGLYDVQADPDMSCNLIATNPEVVDRILDRFRDWSVRESGEPQAYVHRSW